LLFTPDERDIPKFADVFCHEIWHYGRLVRVKNRLNFEAKVTDENQSYNND